MKIAALSTEARKIYAADVATPMHSPRSGGKTVTGAVARAGTNAALAGPELNQKCAS